MTDTFRGRVMKRGPEIYAVKYILEMIFYIVIVSYVIHVW